MTERAERIINEIKEKYDFKDTLAFAYIEYRVGQVEDRNKRGLLLAPFENLDMPSDLQKDMWYHDLTDDEIKEIGDALEPVIISDKKGAELEFEPKFLRMYQEDGIQLAASFDVSSLDIMPKYEMIDGKINRVVPREIFDRIDAALGVMPKSDQFTPEEYTAAQERGLKDDSEYAELMSTEEVTLVEPKGNIHDLDEMFTKDYLDFAQERLDLMRLMENDQVVANRVDNIIAAIKAQYDPVKDLTTEYRKVREAQMRGEDLPNKEILTSHEIKLPDDIVESMKRVPLAYHEDIDIEDGLDPVVVSNIKVDSWAGLSDNSQKFHIDIDTDDGKLEVGLNIDPDDLVSQFDFDGDKLKRVVPRKYFDDIDAELGIREKGSLYTSEEFDAAKKRGLEDDSPFSPRYTNYIPYRSEGVEKIEPELDLSDLSSNEKTL